MAMGPQPPSCSWGIRAHVAADSVPSRPHGLPHPWTQRSLRRFHYYEGSPSFEKCYFITSAPQSSPPQGLQHTYNAA
eukprot:893800-Pelagomonas_calceolata.AAC.1